MDIESRITGEEREDGPWRAARLNRCSSWRWPTAGRTPCAECSLTGSWLFRGAVQMRTTPCVYRTSEPPRWESWSPRILPVPFPRALWPRAPRQCTPSEAPRRGQRPGSPEAMCWSPSMRPFWSPSFGRTKPRNQNSGPQITMRRDLRRFGIRRILELFRAPGETANGNACPAGQMDAPDAACAKHRGRDRRQSADTVLGAQGRQYQGARPPLQSASWPTF